MHHLNGKVDKSNFRIGLPFCHINESLSRLFLKKHYSFIGDSFSISILWNTRKIRSLFPLKDKNLHPCCVVYEGLCSCDKKYMGETDRCIHLRTNKHENLIIQEPGGGGVVMLDSFGDKFPSISVER